MLWCYRTLSGVGGRSKIHTARPWLKKKPALAPSLSLNETESSEEEPASVAAAASTQVNDYWELTLIYLSLFCQKYQPQSKELAGTMGHFFLTGHTFVLSITGKSSPLASNISCSYAAYSPWTQIQWRHSTLRWNFTALFVCMWWKTCSVTAPHYQIPHGYPDVWLTATLLLNAIVVSASSHLFCA